MAKIKLTKSAVDAAQPQAQAVELRDTLVPGFLCKISRSFEATSDPEYAEHHSADSRAR